MPITVTKKKGRGGAGRGQGRKPSNNPGIKKSIIFPHVIMEKVENHMQTTGDSFSFTVILILDKWFSEQKL